jgi:phenylalanyl-tRNA synthetase beta chain
VRVDGDACRLFSGRVIRGVKNGPSPDWLQKKLASIGLKPISALVDITNYLGYDRCRPLHVYDLSKLAGSEITAGLPSETSEVPMLDGKTYAVTPDMCAIMDPSGVIGLGGVMGGETTKVEDATTDIFLESAWFDPIRTAQTVRTTTISSDAGYRFARGVDPEFVVPGLELATRLILDICGGEPSDIVVDGQAPARRAGVSFDPAYVEKLTGLAVSPDETKRILTALGFAVSGNIPWMVQAPSWRRDVDGKADLVEEVARIHGFNAIPATPLPVVSPRPGGVLTAQQAKARTARRALAAMGYAEAVTWSFMRQDWAVLFGGGADTLVLANPIASELNCMRPSALPNLLEAAGRNAARGLSGVRLFEIGPVYQGLEPGDQKPTVAAIRAPDKSRSWHSAGESPLFALKGDLYALLDAMGAPVASLQLAQGSNASHWHPGRSARLQLGPKQVLVEFGELHPAVLKAMDLDGPVTGGAYVGFEIRLDTLPAPKARAGKSRGALSLSNLMPLTRDFAFLVADTVAAGDLVRAVKGADKMLIADAQVFDLYTGAGVAEGYKSVAVEVTLQPVDKTLTDPEIEAVAARVVAAAGKLGATLRS